MTFEEILDQAIAMLQRRGRVTYQTLRLQFQLDEEHLEALPCSSRTLSLSIRQAGAWSGSVTRAPYHQRLPRRSLWSNLSRRLPEGARRQAHLPHPMSLTLNGANSRCCFVISSSLRPCRDSSIPKTYGASCVRINKCVQR